MKNFGFISMIVGIALFVCATIGGIVYTYIDEHKTTDTVVTETVQADTVQVADTID